MLEKFIWLQESYTLSGERRCVPNPLRSTCLFVCPCGDGVWKWRRFLFDFFDDRLWMRTAVVQILPISGNLLEPEGRGHVNLLPPELVIERSWGECHGGWIWLLCMRATSTTRLHRGGDLWVIWSGDTHFFEVKSEMKWMKYLIWSTLSYGHLQIRDSTTADQAHDQCTPEACECGNSRTHAQLPWFLRKTDENLWKDAKKPPFCRSVFGWVCQVKHSATTVDGSPCFYCLDSEVWKTEKIRSNSSTTLRWSHQWSGLGKAWSHGESAGQLEVSHGMVSHMVSQCFLTRKGQSFSCRWQQSFSWWFGILEGAWDWAEPVERGTP